MAQEGETITIKTVKDFKKLCIMNVEQATEAHHLHSICAQYGQLQDFKRFSLKKLAFALYISEKYVHIFIL